jgi:hypothetical protein
MHGLLTKIIGIFKGSEIYQESLVKALTKHFGAKLLIIDPSLLASVSFLTITMVSFSRESVRTV